MVKEIQMFEASNGTTHRTMLDALKADLVATLVSDQLFNEGQANQLATRIVNDDDLRDLMTQIDKHVMRVGAAHDAGR